MSRNKWILLTTLACISANTAWGQGPPERAGGGGRGEAPAIGRTGMPYEVNRQQMQVQATQDRIQAQANQRATQQADRRMMEGANRAAERAGQAAAQRAAHPPAGYGIPTSQTGAPGRYPVGAETAESRADLQRRAAVDRANYPEDLQRDGNASEDKRKFPKFSKQGFSGFVKKVFGLPNSSESSMTDSPMLPPEGTLRGAEYGQARSQAALGANANPNAKLANAIRVRQTQISTLRDLAVETGDTSLMERADQLEQNLQILLANQARIQARQGLVTGDPNSPMEPVEGMQPVDLTEFDLVETTPATPATPVGYQSTSAFEPSATGRQ